MRNKLFEQANEIVRNDEYIKKALDIVEQKLPIEVLRVDKNICVSPYDFEQDAKAEIGKRITNNLL